MNLSPAGVRKMIAEVAENARFREEASRQDDFSRTRNVAKAETPSNSMAEELKQMKEMMQKLIMKQPVQVKPCEFCGATNHKTDSCPSLQEEEHGCVNAVGEFQNYNNQTPQQPQQQYYRPPYRPSNQSGCKSLEDVVKELAASTQQIATSVQQHQRDPRKLPLQTVPNPRGNISTLAMVDETEVKNSEKEA
ncbi:unnamed protein product [Rhodiola kirilowii]